MGAVLGHIVEVLIHFHKGIKFLSSLRLRQSRVRIRIMKIIHNDPEKKQVVFEAPLSELLFIHTAVAERKKSTTDPEVADICTNILREINVARQGKTHAILAGVVGNKHKRLKDTQCPFCPRKARGQGALVAHIAVVHPTEGLRI